MYVEYKKLLTSNTPVRKRVSNLKLHFVPKMTLRTYVCQIGSEKMTKSKGTPSQGFWDSTSILQLHSADAVSLGLMKNHEEPTRGGFQPPRLPSLL